MPTAAVVLRYVFGARTWCPSIGITGYLNAPYSRFGVWATTANRIDVWFVRIEREVFACRAYLLRFAATRRIRSHLSTTDKGKHSESAARDRLRPFQRLLN